MSADRIKLYLSADLEGAMWVTSPAQCSPEGDPDAYHEAVDRLGMEVQTVIDAALAAGAVEIVVNDSHFGMTNLRLEHVGAQVSLLSGKPKICAMSAGLDGSFDAAIYVGYHAKAGTANGILNHTFHSRLFDVSINGVSYGEGGVNALYASLVHGVPVVLASGDQAFCEEIRAHVPGIETVRTKTSLSTTAALSRPEEAVLNDYDDAVQRVFAVRSQWPERRLSLKGPYTLEVTFISSLDADCAMMIPGLERLDGRRVRYVSDSFQLIYQMLQSSYAILAYAAPLHY